MPVTTISLCPLRTRSRASAVAASIGLLRRAGRSRGTMQYVQEASQPSCTFRNARWCPAKRPIRPGRVPIVDCRLSIVDLTSGILSTRNPSRRAGVFRNPSRRAGTIRNPSPLTAGNGRETMLLGELGGFLQGHSSVRSLPQTSTEWSRTVLTPSILRMRSVSAAAPHPTAITDVSPLRVMRRIA